MLPYCQLTSRCSYLRIIQKRKFERDHFVISCFHPKSRPESDQKLKAADAVHYQRNRVTFDNA